MRVEYEKSLHHDLSPIYKISSLDFRMIPAMTTFRNPPFWNLIHRHGWNCDSGGETEWRVYLPLFIMKTDDKAGSL